MKARKIVIPIVIVAGIAAIAVVAVALSKQGAAPSYTDSSLIERQSSLQNYVSVSGTVESGSFNQIYSSINYPIEAINVAIGDKVKKGDLLCTLNTSDLESQILEQQITIDNSNNNTEYQLTQAEKDYAAALAKYNDGTNAQIAAAEQAVTNAKVSLDKAQNDYDDAVKMSKQDKNTQLQTAQLTLTNAQKELTDAQESLDKTKKDISDEDYYDIKSLKDALDDAEKVLKTTGTSNSEVDKAYNAYKNAYAEYTYAYYYPDMIPVDKTIATYSAALSEAESNLAAITDKYNLKNAKESYEAALKEYNEAKNDIDKANQKQLDTAQSVLDTAKRSVTSAEISLQSVKDSTSNGIDTYKVQLDNAKLNYEQAKDSLELTRKEASADVETLKNSAERERTLSGLNSTQLITLENLKDKLKDAVISAPCDGTVTLVGASVGSIPTGTLFVIEDEADLIVKAKLREYDLNSVEVGMPVTIKSDASSENFNGIVTKIAPTASKNPDGTDAGTAMFEVEVAVTDNNTSLKIGMTAKMNIITEEKHDVLTAMVDSITADKDGNDIIYIAEKTDLGYTAKAVKVTVGLQTDYLAEISGEGISENDIVINDIALITDGQTVMIDEAELGIADAAAETTASEGTEA